MKVTHVGHDFNNFLIIEHEGEKIEVFVDPVGENAKGITGWDYQFRLKDKEGKVFLPTSCCSP